MDELLGAQWVCLPLMGLSPLAPEPHEGKKVRSIVVYCLVVAPPPLALSLLSSGSWYQGHSGVTFTPTEDFGILIGRLTFQLGRFAPALPDLQISLALWYTQSRQQRRLLWQCKYRS